MLKIGAWRATVHGVTRVRNNLASKPPPHFYDGILFGDKKKWAVKLHKDMEETETYYYKNTVRKNCGDSKKISGCQKFAG